jgi:uncharacterized protein YbaR (Trm112 family)
MMSDTPVLDVKMLELLVCPQTGGNLDYDEAAQELISKKAKLAYPVRDGVPMMLVSEARALED